MKTYKPYQDKISIIRAFCNAIPFMFLMSSLANAQVTTVAALVTAVNNGTANSTVNVGAGTFQLTAPLIPKAGMKIIGTGMNQTILINASSWVPSTTALPEGGTDATKIVTGAYLFSLTSNTNGIEISNMTLKGPQLHGALYGYNNDNLRLYNLKIQDFLWSGIRTFAMDGAQIRDCEFIDAGGRWNAGSPGTTGGTTGGAIYATWMKTSEIWNNRFTRVQTGGENNFYGIKGREGKNSSIHHNTINVDFAIEFPFENDHTMQIYQNVCRGAISIPKSAGGVFPSGGYAFRIRNNYFSDSYALEWPRNGTEVDHNLFDFSLSDDSGNLISGFGSAAAGGPGTFHNNLVKNPGRGVYWVNEIFNNMVFRNNHIITNTTVTPRTEGLFGFNSGCNFSTITIKDNIIECIGQARPLVRNTASNSAFIQNNTLTNVSDTANYANASTSAVRGLEAPLSFTCGVNNESTVNGWNFGPTLVTVNTTADTFTRDSTFASTNYGTAASLTVKSIAPAGFTRRSYLKFPVTSLASSANVNLILKVDSLGTEGTSGFTVELRQLTTDTWTETGLTWNNQPAAGTLINSFNVLPADVGNQISISVSAYVAQQAAGDGTASFVLVQPADGNRTINFSSKEGALAPRLEGTP